MPIGTRLIRAITAALAALLISTVAIGSAVGPAHLTTTASA